MRGAHAAGILGLLGITLGLFGDALFRGDGLVLSMPGGDLATQFLHWRAFGFEELRQGNLPLWNPLVFCGIPFFGGTQSALLYPGNFPYLILPTPVAANLGVALHVYLVGLFAYLWAARSGLHPLACFFAGATLLLSAPHLSHVAAGHLSNLSAMPWIPAALLAVDGLRERGGLGWMLFATGVFACLLLAGHPQYALYGALTVGLWVAVTWRGASDWRRAPGKLAIAAGVAVMIAAVQLVAAAREAPYGLRAGGVPWEFASMFSLPPENLVTLIAPGFFGGTEADYWGRAQSWEVTIFFGVTGLVLALRGAFGSARGQAAGIVAVVLGLLALGANTPLYRGLYEVVPWLDRFRGAAKFGYFAVVFASLLAGIGLHRVLEGVRPSLRGLAVPAVSALFALGGAWLVANATVEGAFGDWMHAVRAAGAERDEAFLALTAYEDPGFVTEAGERAARSLGIGAGTLAAVALLLAVARRWRPAAAGLVVVAVGELLWFAWPQRITFDPAPPLYETLGARAAQDESDDRIFNTLAPNSAMTTRAADIWGHDPGTLRRYAEFVTATQGGDPDAAGQNVDFRSIPPLYGMLRLRHAIVQNAGRAQMIPAAEPLPRWQLVGRYDVQTERHVVFASLSASDFAPAHEVILEAEPDPPPASDPPVAQVGVLAESTDRIDFEIAVEEPSLLLMTDAYHPYWRAEPLPGSASDRYEVLAANWVLRAIPLAAGEHRIRLEYRIPGLGIAAAVSIVAALAWLGGGIVWIVRRRHAEVV